jgi:hypothetical protein
MILFSRTVGLVAANTFNLEKGSTDDRLHPRT